MAIKKKGLRIDQGTVEFLQRSSGRFDAAESAVIAEQIEIVKVKAYNQRHPELKARSLVPLDNSVPASASSVVIRSFTQFGVAKLLATYADDLPRADVKGDEKVVMFKGLGNAYGWGLDEARLASAPGGVSLSEAKAAAARRAFEVAVDTIFAVGIPSLGWYGLLNQPNMTEYTPPNGAAGSPLWEDKTPEEIVADLNGLVDSVVTASNEVESVDTIVMGRARWRTITTRPFSTQNPNVTILEWWQKANPGIRIEVWQKAETAGDGGGNRIVAYRNSPEFLVGFLPQDFEQLPVQEVNLEFKVPCHGRVGGVTALYPLSMAYMDSI